ncbi:unnamed protein product [Musa acuminata subsp. burmannicoides]
MFLQNTADRLGALFHMHARSYSFPQQCYREEDRVVSVRALPHDVARRVVVADDEDGAAVALHPSTADGRRVPPHHLRVVAADLAVSARVAVVVVVLLLVDPAVDGVGCGEVGAGAPEEVLPVRPAGVHELAVADALVGVVLSVRGDVGVPRHGANADGRPGRVVGVHEVLGGVLREGGAGHGQGHSTHQSRSVICRPHYLFLSLTLDGINVLWQGERWGCGIY